MLRAARSCCVHTHTHAEALKEEVAFTLPLGDSTGTPEFPIEDNVSGPSVFLDRTCTTATSKPTVEERSWSNFQLWRSTKAQKHSNYGKLHVVSDPQQYVNPAKNAATTVVWLVWTTLPERAEFPDFSTQQALVNKGSDSYTALVCCSKLLENGNTYSSRLLVGGP
jgi:hypothetical protein